jgi:hypothetical protein
MVKRVGNSAVQAISANDLKNGGIGAIAWALEHEREVGLSVRGELRYVVMEAAVSSACGSASWTLLCRKPAPTSPPVAL